MSPESYGSVQSITAPMKWVVLEKNHIPLKKEWLEYAFFSEMTLMIIYIYILLIFLINVVFHTVHSEQLTIYFTITTAIMRGNFCDCYENSDNEEESF